MSHFQVGFLVLNLILTVLIGAQSLYAVFQKPEFPGVKRWPDPAELRDVGPPTSPVTAGLTNWAGEIGRRFEARPPAEVPAPTDPTAAGPPAVAEASGPLGKYFELSMSLVTGEPGQCFCILSRKGPDKVKALKPRILIQRGKETTPAGRSQPVADTKMLRVMDRWLDEDLGIDIRILEVTAGRVRYEDLRGGSGASYTLVKPPLVPGFRGKGVTP